MDNGATMKYTMKRSQIFIRPGTSVPFHTQVDTTWIDRIKETTGEFTDDCLVEMDYVGDRFLRVHYWLPELEDYLRMTDCLYAKGQIKEVFKDAMRHSKNNRIAFAMPSWHMNKRNENGIYVKEWYTNKKTRPDSKFLEEVKDTLEDRMYAFKGYMSLEDCIMNCAVYDYDHSVKHSYFLFLKRDEETEKAIDDFRTNASKNYAYKRHFNREQGVEAMINRCETSNLQYHDFHDIPPGIFTPEFNSLNIPLL
jgi:hypothetical protein